MPKNMNEKNDLNKPVGNENDTVLPPKVWLTLKECCELKGLNYKTACNQKNLQPNRGIPEGKIGGRKCFRRETVFAWLDMSDEDILGGKNE